MIQRIQAENIRQWLGKGKAIIVIGPRQVGKTTLVRQITQSLDQKVHWLTGDNSVTPFPFDNIRCPPASPHRPKYHRRGG